MTLAMPPQKAARGLAGNPVFLLKQRWEAGGGCRWPPCQLEGGLGPEIEPGGGLTRAETKVGLVLVWFRSGPWLGLHAWGEGA